jgi:hypothetical protein
MRERGDFFFFERRGRNGRRKTTTTTTTTTARLFRTSMPKNPKKHSPARPGVHQALPVPIDVENKGVALPEATELAARGGSGSGAVDGGGGSGGGGSGFLLSLSLGGGPGVSFVDHDVGGHHGGRGGHHR